MVIIHKDRFTSRFISGRAYIQIGIYWWPFEVFLLDFLGFCFSWPYWMLVILGFLGFLCVFWVRIYSQIPIKNGK